jgi:hypothetical protein
VPWPVIWKKPGEMAAARTAAITGEVAAGSPARNPKRSIVGIPAKVLAIVVTGKCSGGWRNVLR